MQTQRAGTGHLTWQRHPFICPGGVLCILPSCTREDKRSEKQARSAPAAEAVRSRLDLWSSPDLPPPPPLFLRPSPSSTLYFTPHPPNIFLLPTSTFLSHFSTFVHSLVPAPIHALSFYFAQPIASFQESLVPPFVSHLCCGRQRPPGLQRVLPPPSRPSRAWLVSFHPV